MDGKESRTNLPRASILERVMVNWAVVPDVIFYHARARVSGGRYAHQSFSERMKNVWKGRIDKYQRTVKMIENHGHVPAGLKRLSSKSPCAYSRLLLARLRTRT